MFHVPDNRQKTSSFLSKRSQEEVTGLLKNLFNVKDAALVEEIDKQVAWDEGLNQVRFSPHVFLTESYP